MLFDAFPSIFGFSSEVTSICWSRYSRTRLKSSVAIFHAEMITVENGRRLRQSGYIIAPDLSPKSQNYRERRMEGRDEGEGGAVGMGER